MNLWAINGEHHSNFRELYGRIWFREWRNFWRKDGFSFSFLKVEGNLSDALYIYLERSVKFVLLTYWRATQQKSLFIKEIEIINGGCWVATGKVSCDAGAIKLGRWRRRGCGWPDGQPAAVSSLFSSIPRSSSEAGEREKGQNGPRNLLRNTAWWVVTRPIEAHFTAHFIDQQTSQACTHRQIPICSAGRIQNLMILSPAELTKFIFTHTLAKKDVPWPISSLSQL